MKIESMDLENLYDQLIKSLVPKASWLDWLLVKALIKQESAFNPLAQSQVGARGLCQIMPDSDQWADGEIDGFDILGNVQDCILLLNRFRLFFIKRGIVEPHLAKFTLASYNAGPGNVDKARTLAIQAGADGTDWDTVAPFLQDITGDRSKETLDYVTKVMANYDAYKGNPPAASPQG